MIETSKTQRYSEGKRKLPESWSWVGLGEVCEFEYGSGLIESARQEGTIPVYGSNGIVGYHNLPLTSGPTIVIGRKGSVGQVHYSPDPCFPIDTTYYIDKVKQPVDLRWFAYILSLLGLPELNKASGVPGLNRNDAYRLLFPLPPLSEQQRIAMVLREQMAAVEKARTAAQARLEAIKDLPAAFLRQVFPQPGHPLASGWRWVKLGEVADVISGQHILESDYNLNECGIGYLTGPADFGIMKPHITKWTENPRVICEPMDVLVTVKGAGVGKINLSPEIPVAIGRQLMAIRVHRESLDTLFLYRFLATCFGHFQGNAMGATVPGLSREDLKTLSVPIPTLPEQQRMAEVLREQLTAVEKAYTAAEEELNSIKALPAALLRRAFSGEI